MQKKYIKMMPVTVSVPLIPLLSFSLGLSLLFWVAWPILSFKFAYAWGNEYVIDPVADYTTQTPQNIDFSDASNWFPEKKAATTESPVDTYTMSIPKLRINKALVRIGTNDLSKNLIHYGGTGIPGKPGNSVIFGHSVLEAFYNPNNYLTIFTLLPKLKKGDDIFISFDGVDYKYEVVGGRVTTPEDVSGLEQRYDDSYITLVTCVPVGTYLERLWVTAKRTTFSEN